MSRRYEARVTTRIRVRFVLDRYSQGAGSRYQCQSDIADVSVEDADGRAVLDLRAQDFEIIENGRATPVTHSSLEVDPIDVAFAIDRSSSIAAEGKRWKRPSGSC